MVRSRHSIILILAVSFGCGQSSENPSRKAYGTNKADGGLQVVGSTVIDFGTQRQNAELEHTFKIRNTTSSDIQVLGVQTSCGCLVPDLNQHGTVIQADGEAEFPMVFATALKKDRSLARAVLTYRKTEKGNNAASIGGHLDLSNRKRTA